MPTKKEIEAMEKAVKAKEGKVSKETMAEAKRILARSKAAYEASTSVRTPAAVKKSVRMGEKARAMESMKTAQSKAVPKSKDKKKGKK